MEIERVLFALELKNIVEGSNWHYFKQNVKCQETYIGPLSHRMLERSRLLKEMETNWLNVAIDTRVQITI